jgi:hypothetical protein
MAADQCTAPARAIGCGLYCKLKPTTKAALTDLLSCPPTSALANIDQRFVDDALCNSNTPKPCMMNPGSESCVISAVPSPSGAGQQCCYKSGNILSGVQGELLHKVRTSLVKA